MSWSYRSPNHAVENIAPLTRRDADWLADEIIELVIKTLRRDEDGAARSSDEWASALGDLRAHIAQLLNRHIVGRVDLDQVMAALEEFAP
jgi:hypothetical protein